MQRCDPWRIKLRVKRTITVLGRQCGLGEAARSWGGSAVLGVSPMSDCRGFPHERLPWFPPLALCIKTTGKHWNNAELHLNKTGKHCFNLCYFSIRLTAEC
ncbi:MULTISPECIES: hypothetical protein [Moorena]|uniref:hypothetical protein n=1 Tax=Moorena TaxID=1155738 RepID=UPI0012B6131E|nr:MULTISPECIES: hypothetical protein [Moorena]